MRLGLRAAGCALVLATLGLTGCTSGLPGTAASNAATPTSTSTSSAASDRQAAPAVGHPLDASAMVAQPCSSLTSADVAGLGLVNAAGRASASGSVQNGCTWAGDAGGAVNVDWVTANQQGLSDLYVKSSTMAYWQPTTVAGYPAVYGDAISDGRSQGDCVLSTAVSNQLYFFAQIDNPLNASRSCTLAATAAADVIRNLGGS